MALWPLGLGCKAEENQPAWPGHFWTFRPRLQEVGSRTWAHSSPSRRGQRLPPAQTADQELARDLKAFIKLCELLRGAPVHAEHCPIAMFLFVLHNLR